MRPMLKSLIVLTKALAFPSPKLKSQTLATVGHELPCTPADMRLHYQWLQLSILPAAHNLAQRHFKSVARIYHDSLGIAVKIFARTVTDSKSVQYLKNTLTKLQSTSNWQKLTVSKSCLLCLYRVKPVK